MDLTILKEKEYQNLLKEIGIKEIGIYHKDLNYGLVTIKGIWQEKVVLLKIISKAHPKKVQSFKKECLIEDYLTQIKGKKEDNLPRTKVISNNENSQFFWIIREYITGDSLANSSGYKEILFGYDKIQDKYLSERDNYLRQISDGLSLLKTLNVNTRKSLQINRYKKEITDYNIKEIEAGIDIDLSKQLSFFDKIRKEFFADINLCATIGDLLPANIIITKDDKIIFSDFEWFSFDNYISDLSFLWLFLWRYPNWQKKLLIFNLNKKDENFFRVSLIRQIIGWYSNPFDPRFKVNKDQRKEYKKHIWSDYLINAGKSFDDLINTKQS